MLLGNFKLFGKKKMDYIEMIAHTEGIFQLVRLASGRRSVLQFSNQKTAEEAMGINNLNYYTWPRNFTL